MNKKLAEAAVESGRKNAAAIVRNRRKQLRQRAKSLAEAGPKIRARAAAATAAPSAQVVRAAGAPATAGVLVAEGDSWFDYPFHDVLKSLEDRHHFDVESVAHRGDRVEDMAYADGQLDDLVRCIEKLLRRRVMPRAVLLSGGGNDIAGREFHMLLNHARSPIAGVSESVVRGIIDERIRFAYLHILSAVTEVCERVAGTRIPILTHGYAYPVPDGRGVLGGWWFLPGPWLEPGFRDKGFRNREDNKAMMRTLIDRFNTMLAEVAATPDLGPVHYVDLRPLLPSGSHYKDYWANEMHPTEDGFHRVAARIAAAVP